MTPFELITAFALMIIAATLVSIAFRGEIKVKFEKKVIQENHMDELQLAIAKQNLEELKKYNENAAKNSAEQAQVIQTMTSAVQDLMGVKDETR
jgi:hypothetical protein